MKRKVDVVAEDLVSRVANGDLSQGDVLPPENALAEEYGVRRGVIREALKILEVHKLVEPVRRKGTMVLDPKESSSPAVLRAMLMPRPGEVNLEMLDAVLEVMQYSEGHIVAMACERRDENNLASMQETIDDMRAALGEPEPFFEASIRFSHELAKATKNQFVVTTTSWFAEIVAKIKHLYLVVAPPSEASVLQREALMDHIIAQDVEAGRKHAKMTWAWVRPRIMTAAKFSMGAGEVEEMK